MLYLEAYLGFHNDKRLKWHIPLATALHLDEIIHRKQ